VARLLRTLGRVTLSAIFIQSGVDQYRHPAGRAKKAAQELPSLPEPELVARGLGVTMAVAGATLALGILPGLSATVLAVSLVPVTYVGHPFWIEEDAAARRSQRVHFMKNVAMLGGLLFVAADELTHEAARGSI
jgi:putative oxidoreductase